MTSGGGRRSRSAASRPARAAACIIGTPPDACTLTIHAPVVHGRRHGLRHRVGNVVELEVEKHAGAACDELR